MKITFYKYHGTGNDFVLIDNRNLEFPKNDNKLIEKICDRRFGIGGDGLILLEKHNELDFEMIYFNADGNIGSMCGNGGRCIVAFAKRLDIIDEKASFLAPDGPHSAQIQDGLVTLNMNDVNEIIDLENGDFQLDTGSPHYVKIVDDVDNNFVEKASRIRNNSVYKNDGINVNFIKINDGNVTMRTFERGVEAETFSCGTGAVAAALVALNEGASSPVSIETQGGQLAVHADKMANGFENIKLKGPAEMVFFGSFTS